MATHAGGVHPGTAPRAHGGAVSGRLVFGAVMMLFGGLMTLAQGIAAVRNDRVFVATQSYVFSYDLGGWGWIHMILGIVLVVAGLATFTGAMWARTVGVVIAGLALLANFLWLPYTPLWATVLMLIDAFVIWALCTGGQGTEPGMGGAGMGGASMAGGRGGGGQGPEPRGGGQGYDTRGGGQGYDTRGGGQGYDTRGGGQGYDTRGGGQGYDTRGGGQGPDPRSGGPDYPEAR